MMRHALRLSYLAALLTCVVPTPSSAQEPIDKRTLFTFSGPVTMPGITLSAGEYLFRLANPETGRDVVQVLSADGTRPYGMFFSIPTERVAAASTPEVGFMETAAGAPAAIRTWSYPDERGGYEFIYPKEQARRLAQYASEPVLTTQAQTTTTEQTNTSNLTRISSTGQETDVRADATRMASTPGGTRQQGERGSATTSIASVTIPERIEAGLAAASGQTTQSRQTARATTTPQDTALPSATAPTTTRQSARASLPQTASTVPMVTVIGTLALFAGIGMCLWPRRRRV